MIESIVPKSVWIELLLRIITFELSRPRYSRSLSCIKIDPYEVFIVNVNMDGKRPFDLRSKSESSWYPGAFVRQPFKPYDQSWYWQERIFELPWSLMNTGKPRCLHTLWKALITPSRSRRIKKRVTRFGEWKSVSVLSKSQLMTYHSQYFEKMARLSSW